MDFSIEIVFIGVLLIVFFSDFILKGIKKKKINAVTNEIKTQSEEKNPKRNLFQFILAVLILGIVIGYFIDYTFTQGIHYYFFKGGIELTIDNLANVIFGFLIAYPLVLFLFSEYFKVRRKNTVLFTLTIMLTKVCAHYFFYPMVYSGRRRSGTPPIEKGFGVHLDTIFTEELWLFVPSILIISFIAWFFNDKIKVR
jgi:hypothetical protein